MRLFHILVAVAALLDTPLALARGHGNPNDPIYTVNPAAVTDGRCTGNHAPEGVWGARCHKWLDRARDVVGCIDPSEYAILHAKNLVPMCDAISGAFTHTCYCGCLAPETRLLALDTVDREAKWIAIEDLPGREDDLELYTLRPDARLGDLHLETKRVAKMTAGVETKPMVAVTLRDGRRLRLTEEHGVLLSDGRMVAAGDLTPADALVTMHGDPASIRSIERLHAAGQRVHNVLIDAPNESKTSHLIIAEGFVVGDLAWQNSLARELDAVAVRQ